VPLPSSPAALRYLAANLPYALRLCMLVLAALCSPLSLAADSAATSPTEAAAPPPGSIALVLPLASPSYGRAAEAVKAGFVAAAQAAKSEARVKVIGHGDENVLPAIAAAYGGGASLIVGPLIRDDLKTVLALDITGARLLALNVTEDGTPLPANVYALTLAVESEGAQLAQAARDEGAQSLAEVVSDTPYEKRLQTSFTAAWEQAGGRSPAVYHFDPGVEMLRLLRRELRAHPVDAVLLSVSPENAALAKSFLPPGPVYTSSQLIDEGTAIAQRDLDNLRFVELPWIADPDNPAFAGLPRGKFGSISLERLYALGIDAFAVAQMLSQASVPSRIDIEGATGRLFLKADHTFSREGRLMVFREGRPVPYERGR